MSHDGGRSPLRYRWQISSDGWDIASAGAATDSSVSHGGSSERAGRLLPRVPRPLAGLHAQLIPPLGSSAAGRHQVAAFCSVFW